MFKCFLKKTRARRHSYAWHLKRTTQNIQEVLVAFSELLPVVILIFIGFVLPWWKAGPHIMLREEIKKNHNIQRSTRPEVVYRTYDNYLITKIKIGEKDCYLVRTPLHHNIKTIDCP